MRWVNGVAALAAFISTPAFAGWQWTSWGMTPQQVAAASPVQVAPYHDAKLDTALLQTELVTTHRSRLYAFSVAMLFDKRTQGLEQVRLLLQGDDQNHLLCADLHDELQRQYGDQDWSAQRSTWRDVAGGNLVSIELNGGCWLIYEPIPTGESGL
jgi:hypothetical protein